MTPTEKVTRESSDSGDSIEVVRDKVFSMPLLPQKQAIDLFHALDCSLQANIDALLNKTNFVESYLSDVVAEVAASVTHGRTIYGRVGKRKKKGEEDNEGEVFKRSSDVKFLEQSINVMHLLAYYSDRELALSAKYKDLTKSLLSEIKFVRLVYEEVIQSFRYQTRGYVELANQAADLHNKFHHARNKTQVAGRSSDYVDVHEEMERIEKAVKVDRAYLWHLCQFIERSYELQLNLRDAIHDPYMRIVYKEAKKHATNSEQVLDNFQNGSTGLLRAISCYNLAQNVSFSSYAHWWIRQAILFHIKDSSNFVKLPVTTWQTYTSVEKQRAKIATRDGEDNLETLADETGHSVTKLKEIYSAVKSSHVHSLDYEVDETGKMMLIDVIADQSIEDKEHDDHVKQEVNDRLEVLGGEHRWAMVLTYGLMGMLDNTKTLDPADILNEQIRQRFARAGS